MKQLTVSDPWTSQNDIKEDTIQIRGKATFRSKKSASIVLDDTTILNCASKDISPDISGSGKPLRARRIKKQRSIESPMEKTGTIFNFDQDEIQSEILIENDVTSPGTGGSGKLLRARRIKKLTSLDDTLRKNDENELQEND